LKGGKFRRFMWWKKNLVVTFLGRDEWGNSFGFGKNYSNPLTISMKGFSISLDIFQFQHSEMVVRLRFYPKKGFDYLRNGIIDKPFFCLRNGWVFWARKEFHHFLQLQLIKNEKTILYFSALVLFSGFSLNQRIDLPAHHPSSSQKSRIWNLWFPGGGIHLGNLTRWISLDESHFLLMIKYTG